MSNKTLIPVIIILSLITIGVASLTQLNKVPGKVGVNPSSEVVSSVKSQVVSSSSLIPAQVSSSSVVSSEQRVAESVKVESQSNEVSPIPTFDSINKANLKLITLNKITSINVGKCNLETKFKTGLCEILNQDSKIIARIYSASGIPMLTERTGEVQKIVTLVRSYGACGLTEYEFNFKTNYFRVSKSLVSPGCVDNSVVEEIKKYEDSYYQNSEKLLLN
jgi:hypothetical protein